MVNQVNLGGRIVSDIILRNTSKRGIPVVDFRVLHKDKRLANPLFIDVEVWGVEASKVSNSVKRNDIVVIMGELRRDVWKNKDDGEARSKIKITANKVVITSEGKDRDSVDSVDAMNV